MVIVGVKIDYDNALTFIYCLTMAKNNRFKNHPNIYIFFFISLTYNIFQSMINQMY